jgi:outer membrane protein OmpA-like peptidoglycan-associated protein
MQPFNSRNAEARATEPSVLFTAAGAQDQLQYWWIDVTNNGTALHYGPYTRDTILLPVSALPGDARQGMYTIEMGGTTRDSQAIHKSTRLSLQPAPAPAAGTRYAVLFDFNSFKALTANRQFLENTIAPLVTDSSTVIIHGHADIIGNEVRNRSLSNNRVNEARQLLEAALNAKGRKGVKFEYYGFGQDKIMSPFGNQLPEERFYNRTVIIDIIQGR